MFEDKSRREFFHFSALPIVGVGAQVSGLAPLKTVEAAARPPFVSVKDFGAVGDGLADDSEPVRQGYGSLMVTGGTLFFPRGRYRFSLELISRNVHILGEGRGASIFMPVTPTGTILRALYREGSWDGANISDVTMLGTGNAQGNAFVAGSDIYAPLDEYTGSTFFSRVQFANFNKCLSRPHGSIGLWVDGCQFGAANFHIWSQSASKSSDRDAMHAGCLIVSRCHMDYFAKAMLYMDSQGTDGGQVVLDNNIFESGPGFVVYVRNFHSSGGVPGMLFRSNWNENTATATDLVIEGTRHQNARFLFAANASSAIRFEDTPVGSCELVASGLQTNNCSLQNLEMIKADPASTVVHERARMFSGTTKGRVRSIGHPSNSEGLRTPWFRMAVPRLKPVAINGKEIMKAGGKLSLTILDKVLRSSVTVADSELYERRPVQRLVVEPSGNLPLTQVANLQGSGWLVTYYIYKLASGPAVQLQINGSNGITGIGELSSHQWEMLANVSKYDIQGPGQVTAYHQSADISTMLISVIGLVTFETLQDATDFINAIR